MLEDLKDIVEQLDSPASFEIEYWTGRVTPFLEPYLTPQCRLADAFCKAVGGEITYGRSVGDYNAFAKKIPVIVYGPHGENWHGADEWVSIQSIHEALEGYSRFADIISRENI